MENNRTESDDGDDSGGNEDAICVVHKLCTAGRCSKDSK